MVYENGFGVKIIADSSHDKLKRGEYNYVVLSSGAEYQILLINNGDTDAMAKVKLEGKSIGTWFIPANDTITIERPSDTARKFTFFAEQDERAAKAGVVQGNDNNGLIEVKFSPKKEQQYIAITSPRMPPYESLQSYESPRTSGYESPRASGYESPRTLSAISSAKFQGGATVLGERSTQTFGRTSEFRKDEIDRENITIIYIRLIASSPSKIPPRI